MPDSCSLWLQGINIGYLWSAFTTILSPALCLEVDQYVMKSRDALAFYFQLGLVNGLSWQDTRERERRDGVRVLILLAFYFGIMMGWLPSLTERCNSCWGGPFCVAVAPDPCPFRSRHEPPTSPKVQIIHCTNPCWLPDFCLNSGSLGLQQLEVGLGFPAGDRGWSPSSRAPDLPTRPVVGDKGPGFSALQKRIPTKRIQE